MTQELSAAFSYQRILVAVDNSKYSDAAVKLAASLARAQGATVVGFHVYAAQLHEQRFLHMEPGLPERYGNVELQQQRSVHESLISTGLRLISESYLDRARALCEEFQVAFEGRLAEGKNYQEVLREASSGEYDLVVLGALGLGARRRSLLGSVCERVFRSFPGDSLVVRNGQKGARDIMVAVDGSQNSYQALAQGLTFGAAMGQSVEVVTVFDPQFHIVAFQRLANVLSEEAASLFRFREQEQLHAEVIDKGLERLYGSYLRDAEELAHRRGQDVQVTLLKGKAFQSILDHAEKSRPSLLVVGRYGQHATEGSDVGSTTENLVRLAPCSVLVVSGALEGRQWSDQISATAAELPWTTEAEVRLQRVSAFAQPMVREAIERYAREHDLPQVTVGAMIQARRTIGW